MDVVQLICSGPCGKSFRPLCNECCREEVDSNAKHRELIMQHAIQNLTQRVDSMDEMLRNLSALLASQMARASPQRELQLPAEVWEQIFQNLAAGQLAQVRATCHRWKAIVDGSPALMGKFVVKLPVDTLVDEHYEPVHLMAKASRMSLEKVEIVAVGNWWRSLGEHLTFLSLNNCKLSLPVLFGMLQFTPNLRHLDLRTKFCYASAAGSVANDFKLNKLQELTLLSGKNVTSFGPLCPRLKRFQILAFLQRGDDERDVVQFLRSVQTTVEEIDVYLTADLLREISGIEQLRLKRVSFRCLSRLEERHLVDFCRMQWSIEDLGIERFGTTSATLCEIGSCLPRLSRITVRITDDGTVLPTFLATMAGLEYLKINGNSKLYMNFGALQSPNLRQLNLHDVRLAHNGLRGYLRKCPNLHTVILEYCTFDNWSEVFGPIEQLPALQRLELVGIVVKNNIGNSTKCFASLKSLKLSHMTGGMSQKMLTTLFRQCAQLEDVQLIDRVDDELVRIVCQSLKRLRRLTLDRCVCLTDSSVEHIVNYCHTLEHLVARDCVRITKSGINLLREKFPSFLNVNDPNLLLYRLAV